MDNRLFSLYHELEFGIILLMCNNVLLPQGMMGTDLLSTLFLKEYRCGDACCEVVHHVVVVACAIQSVVG